MDAEPTLVPPRPDPTPWPIVAGVYVLGGLLIAFAAELAWALSYVCSPVPPTTIWKVLARTVAFGIGVGAPVLALRRFAPTTGPGRVAIGMGASSVGALVAALVDPAVFRFGLDTAVTLALMAAGMVVLPLSLLPALVLEAVLAGLRWRARR